jgi:hypothetical protein
MAFLATIVFSIVVFVIIDNGGWYAATLFPMESGGWYAATLFSLLFGLAFFVFSPCLLIAATILFYFSKRYNHSQTLNSRGV